ncbi:actin-related protein 5 [Octopus bimaculoides]|uniref:Actin-related protein 5 n=1 Tax=Octopus bimaculoides TaxID=37653 RepID=A0A0L8H1G3_OCTBM|nr:actin-related protein 5 [Octopus bimaculoides]XP_014776304.1 actin-related protein 5 [Octopus bimaculoides]XP_014776305.1 actin-related protein 5 [Octopus bimaculoides]XP_014776307.1 actin-related protein 5 [Octopus bimaculoides]|eukprot:XP_014776303.1 PREDICTED: actin-related protein 5-like [Octopus bimaculoides]
MSADEEEEEENVFSFKDDRPVPDSVYTYPSGLRESAIPLVIDNGSYQCRAGWASMDKPQLIFKNVTAKQRGKKESELQVGNDISNLEVVRWILRTQFDRNVVTQYDVQEQVFDYIFNHLGIDTESCVDHPIVMSEALCNPNYCRQQMSELLFECYHVPKVAYGNDALFSLYKNHPKPESANALIVDCGYQTTHVIPFINGQIVAENCRRLNLGGLHLDSFLHRLLQLKYPNHLAAITLSRAEELVQHHTHMAVNYHEELAKWADYEYYEANVHKIQLPFTLTTEAQITLEQQKERREQHIRRLKEINAKRRLDKLQENEEHLLQLKRIQLLLEEDDEDALKKYHQVLKDMGFHSSDELLATMNKLSANIQRTRAKIHGKELTEEPENKEESKFDLLNIPDEMLTIEQQAAKRKQHILKAAQEGQAQAQALQQAKIQTEVAEELLMEQKRLTDFDSWLYEVRQKRKNLLESRTNRRQRKIDMAKRRTLASQQRMKIISQLAQNNKKQKDDNFGQNDADWDVYKEINPDGGDTDSEVEEEQLEELETMLREHDPEFLKELEENAGIGEFDIAEYYRLHLGVERIRVPELLFQPSMIGIEQAGLSEMVDYVLKKCSPSEQNALVQCVFLTGSNAMFNNFNKRMERDLLAIRPFQTTFSVYRAADPILDAWHGARQWALSPLVHSCSVTRAMYEEMGGEYLIEHVASNRYFPTPVLVSK